VYSPWGRRSGAHINPAFTATMFRLGRVSGRDALAYAVAQFTGGAAGVFLLAALLGDAFLAPPVAAVATLPGPWGQAVAFFAELGISFGLVLMVLTLGQSARLGKYTGFFVGAALFLYITFDAPLSGMSMNPARTLASALPLGHWRELWIYFTAPLLGMLLASEAHVRQLRRRSKRPGCAKVVHSFPCIFCGGAAAPSAAAPRARADARPRPPVASHPQPQPRADVRDTRPTPRRSPCDPTSKRPS